MHGIDVIEEQEADRGWRFRCRIADEVDLELTLDWIDYHRWCPGGTAPPSVVAEAVLACMLDEGVTLGASFDAGRIRRLGPHADDQVRKRLEVHDEEG